MNTEKWRLTVARQVDRFRLGARTKPHRFYHKCHSVCGCWSFGTETHGKTLAHTESQSCFVVYQIINLWFFFCFLCVCFFFLLLISSYSRSNCITCSIVIMGTAWCCWCLISDHAVGSFGCADRNKMSINFAYDLWTVNSEFPILYLGITDITSYSSILEPAITNLAILWYVNVCSIIMAFDCLTFVAWFSLHCDSA